METSPAGPVEVFRPLPSLGWLWSLALAVLSLSGLVIMVWVIAVDPSEQVEAWVWAMVLVLELPLGGLFIVLAVLHPTMRYEVSDTQLALRFGPILHYRIPFADIVTVETRDLSAQMWSSMRWPGLALYSVGYSKVGVVRMCSTRVNKGIVIIETSGGKRYGVSPAEPDRFIATLKAHARLNA